MTLNICHKIIEIYTAMKYVGFSRLDSALFHIFLLDNNNVKLIDTAKAMKKRYTYPTIILENLNKLNCKTKFLTLVKDNYPDIYLDWKKSNKNFKE